MSVVITFLLNGLFLTYTDLLRCTKRTRKKVETMQWWFLLHSIITMVLFCKLSNQTNEWIVDWSLGLLSILLYIFGVRKIHRSLRQRHSTKR